jgi:hypothetical protein
MRRLPFHMSKAESAREAALRRVAEQEARVEKQRGAAGGTSTKTAERLLVTMEETLTALHTSLNSRVRD